MFVVALTRWAQPLEAELAPLAKALGAEPYDLRLKLSGTLPVYAYRGPDLARAQAVLAIVQERGHGAVACDLEQVRASDTMLTPRNVVFEADVVRVEWGVTQDTLDYADLLAVIHALETNEVDGLEKAKESKLSLGRAALTGGLVWSKTETSEKQVQSREAEPVLYLFRRNGEAPVLLRQQTIRISGPGLVPPRTSVEAFQVTVKDLRQRAPHALYDNRLLTNKRKATIASHVANTSKTTTTHSNAGENDLAAHVLALAFLKRQL